MVAKEHRFSYGTSGLTLPVNNDDPAVRGLLEVTSPQIGRREQASDEMIIAGSKRAIASSRRLLASFVPSVGFSSKRSPEENVGFSVGVRTH